MVDSEPAKETAGNEAPAKKTSPLVPMIVSSLIMVGAAYAVVSFVLKPMIHPTQASVADAVQKVVRGLGGLDVAVANAGFSVAGRIEKLSAADWRRQLDVNVIGAAMTARYAIPHLREREGRLALIGSVTAMMSTPGVGAYSASKYAVRAIGQVLAMELHGSGVSCTTIHPGYIESEIAQVDNQGRFDAAREDRRPKNLMWPADRAARVMVDAIAKRKREYTFTVHGKAAAFAGRHMPGVLHFGFTRAKPQSP